MNTFAKIRDNNKTNLWKVAHSLKNGGVRVCLCDHTVRNEKIRMDCFLFRMLETVDGYVKIDGDDVAKLPLGTHRARLNIIPQVCLVYEMQILNNQQQPKLKILTDLPNPILDHPKVSMKLLVQRAK